MTKRLDVLAAGLAAFAVHTASPAMSGPKPGTCSGKLAKLPEGEWVLMFPPEGICAFANEAIKTKVLATCSEGRNCEITGLIGDCEDSGECVEVKRLFSVRKKIR